MGRLKISNLGSVGLIQDTLAEEAPPEAFTDGQNVRFTTQGARAMLGHRPVFKPAPITPLWHAAFPPLSQPIWAYSNGPKMYAWDGSAHEDITRAVGGNYSGFFADRWQGFVFNDVGIFNNGVDVPQKWLPMTSLQKLINLENWPATLRAKAIRPYKNFLFAIHTIEANIARPFRIRWSNAAFPGTVPPDWDILNPASLGGEVDLAETADYAVDGLSLGEIFVVYKERSAWAFQLVQSNDVFINWQIVYDRGLLHRDCVQLFPGGHFVVGQDDIYVHQGQKRSDKSVVQDRMRKWLFRQLDDQAVAGCYTMINREETEVWFCFPEIGETTSTLALVWNWVSGGVGIKDLPHAPYTAAGVVDEDTNEDIWGEQAITGFSLGLIAGRATVSGVADRVIGASGSLVAASASTTGVGTSNPAGWPSITNPLYRFITSINATSGPIRLSTLTFVNEAGDLTARYSNQPSQITINFGPGVIVRGDYNGDPEHKMPALLLDRLQPASVIYLNVNGGALLGAGGKGGDGGTYPNVVLEQLWGENGQAGWPGLVADNPCYIKVTNGDVRGGGGGGGGGGTTTATGADGGGGGGGVGGYGIGFGAGGVSSVAGAAGAPATTPINYATAAPGLGYAGALANDAGNGGNWGLTGAAHTGEGAAGGSAGVGGYTFVTRSGGDILLVNTTETGARQVYGSLTGSVDSEAINATVPNGLQLVGYVDFTMTGAANDKFVKVIPNRLSGDSNISAVRVWHNGISNRINFYSTGTNRTRVARFRIDVIDAAERQAIIGTVDVRVTHGVVLYDVDVAPPSIDSTFQGPGTANFSKTYSQQFSGTVLGGLGPFIYTWTTTLGTIVSGQDTPTVVLEVFSDFLASGASSTKQGTLTLTVNDTGADGDQVIAVVPIKYVTTNLLPQVVHTGTGALKAQRAKTVGTGTKTAFSSYSIDITPNLITQLVTRTGINQQTATFTGSASVAVTGGTPPYTYIWSTTMPSATFPSGNTAASTSLRRVITAPPDSEVQATGNLTVQVRDVTTTLRTQTIAVTFILDNTLVGGGGGNP